MSYNILILRKIIQMSQLKHRKLHNTPARVFSKSFAETGIFDNTRHALTYILLNKNGSSGGQANANELGAHECIKLTHDQYSPRGEGLGDRAITPPDLHWVITDIDKIKGHNKIKTCQYDEPINKMFRAHNPRIKRGINQDTLVYQVNQNTQRPLTSEEILDCYDKEFGNGVKKTVYPPDTIQQEVIKERAEHREQNKNANLLINSENLHTRLGKDKVNALGIAPKCKVVIDISGFFATWQIKDELGENDYWVETQQVSIEKIKEDIEYGLLEGKRIWLPISSYITEDHEKIKLLELFKDTNVAIVVDEPDYQVWKQIDLIPGVLKYVIN